MENVRIRMLRSFDILVKDSNVEAQLGKSRKGQMLLQYLILQHGASVPNFKLYEVLWPNEGSSNPENALKTLVSRIRSTLGKCSEELSGCIVTERGSYRWNLELDIPVDMYEFEAVCSRLTDVEELTSEVRADYARMLNLYTGDLLPGMEQEDWIISRSVALHNEYLHIIYKYLDLLKAVEDYDEIIHVARIALDIDAFDEKLHLELMNALVKLSRNNEALMQYKHATNLHLKYLGVQPPEGIQEFYKQIIQAGNTLNMSIDAIKRMLEEDNEERGAFVCEYAVFKEIYNLQIRNLKRLGSSMFIAIIMVSSIGSKPMDPLKLDETMKGLLNILKMNLRKGDTITHFNANQYALLLPTVNTESCKMVIERMKKLFYVKYPNSSIMLTYRMDALNPPQSAPTSGGDARVPQ